MNELLLQTMIENQDKQQKTINEIRLRIDKIQEQQDQLAKAIPKADNIAALQLMLSTGLNGIKQLIAEQPKPVIQEKRFILLPDFRGPELYGLLFRFLLYTLMATYTYFLLKYGVTAWSR